MLPAIWPIIFCACAKRSSNWLTSVTLTPEPLAMRTRREALMIFGVTRSVGVIDRMIAAVRSRSRSSTCLSCSFICPAPGSRPSRLAIGPILRMASICSRKSSRVKPSREASLPAIASAWSASNACSACSMRVRTSPMPRMREAIRSGWKTSKSASFSPVEANMIG